MCSVGFITLVIVIKNYSKADIEVFWFCSTFLIALDCCKYFVLDYKLSDLRSAMGYIVEAITLLVKILPKKA